VTPPNELHGGEDAVMQPCEIYWVQVRIPTGEHALQGMTMEQTEEVHRGLCAAAVSPAFPSAAPRCIQSTFETLMREHRERAANASLREIAARAALHTLLVQTVRDVSESIDRQTHLSQPLSQALHWMEAHLSESFTIDDAAASAELSVTAFHDRFQREVGTTPVEWRTQKRIDQAKTWLVRDPEKSVTEIALMLGFGSSQYFATAFKRYTAHTPTEYRQKHQSTASR
jgi:AraC-like DNA-binding protein